MSGQVLNLYVKPGHGLPMAEVTRVTAVDGQGLEGDSSFGRSKRQVLLLEQETIAEYGLVPGQLRENVTVQGVALAGMAEGSLIQVGQVVLSVTGDCAPCQQVEEIRPGLRDAMKGRRGTLCLVETGGEIQIGDAVALI